MGETGDSVLLSDRNENSKLFFSWSCDLLEFSWLESSLWRDLGSVQLPDYLLRIKRIFSPWQFLDPELATTLETYLEFHEQLQLAYPTYSWKSPPSTSTATSPFCVLSALTLLRSLCCGTSYSWSSPLEHSSPDHFLSDPVSSSSPLQFSASVSLSLAFLLHLGS